MDFIYFYFVDFIYFSVCLIFVFLFVLFPWVDAKPDPSVKSGSPRALAQKLSGDVVVDDDEEGVDEDDDGDAVEVCQIRVCQKMIEDLQLKIFNIERNLIGQIEMLKEKLEIESEREGRKKKVASCQFHQHF